MLQGTNFNTKFYILTFHFIIFYFFIGNNETSFKMFPLFLFISLYVASVYKTYTIEKFTRH